MLLITNNIEQIKKNWIDKSIQFGDYFVITDDPNVNIEYPIIIKSTQSCSMPNEPISGPYLKITAIKDSLEIESSILGLFQGVYYLSNGTFAISDSIRNLCNALDIKFEVDTEYLKSFLAKGITVNSNRTFYKNIFRIPRDKSVTLGKNTIDFKLKSIFSDIVSSTTEGKLAEHSDKLYSMVKASVYNMCKHINKKQIKTALFLSGGLDSSVLLHHIDEYCKEIVDISELIVLITLKSNKKLSDESGIARKLAQDYSFKHYFVTVDGTNLFDYFDELTDAYQYPTSSISYLAEFMLFKKAQELDVKAVIFGRGIDCMFGEGYGNYIRYIKELRSSSLAHSIREFLCLIKNTDIMNIFYNFIIQREYSKRKSALFSENELLTPVPVKSENLQQRIINSYFYGNTTLSFIDNEIAEYFNMNIFMPFSDNEMARFLFTLPLEFKYFKGWSKYLFRYTYRNVLPKSIVFRKDKKGFFLPEKEIIKNQLYDKIIEKFNGFEDLKNIIGDSANLRKYSSQIIWRLMFLDRWLKKF